MRQLATLLATAALLAACGKNSLSAMNADSVRKALPKPESIQIGTPEARVASARAASGDRAALVQSAPTYGSVYAATSYWTAVTVNVGVWWTLTSVRAVTLLPPTRCDADSCAWGPVLGDDHLNVWTLEVTRAGSGYDWSLSAHPATGGAEAKLISGHAIPGADQWHGSGTFTVDFDASAALAHAQGWEQTDFGTLDVAYDNRTTLSVDATFLGARSQDPKDPCNMNAAYAFDATASGGTLQLGFHNLDTDATLGLHTRWNETGAGRGDARFAQQSTTVNASQCWDGAPGYGMVWDGTTLTGDEALCAFADAEPPTIAIP
jgi:hypothetical protein